MEGVGNGEGSLEGGAKRREESGGCWQSERRGRAQVGVGR